MKKYPIEVKLKLNISEEDVTDLMCNAIEGGIGYWACLDNRDSIYHDPCHKEMAYAETAAEILINGGEVVFIDEYDDDKPVLKLTLDKLLKGLTKWLEEYDHYGAVDGKELDFCNIDADGADSIIQLALFDDIVYG